MVSILKWSLCNFQFGSFFFPFKTEYQPYVYDIYVYITISAYSSPLQPPGTTIELWTQKGDLTANIQLFLTYRNSEFMWLKLQWAWTTAEVTNPLFSSQLNRHSPVTSGGLLIPNTLALVLLFSLYPNPTRYVSRKENWGSEKVNNMPKATWCSVVKTEFNIRNIWSVPEWGK